MVNDAIITIQRTAHKLAFEAWQYLQRWRKYSTLWSFDKNLAAEKYAATQPTLHQYDEKFSFYSNILDEVMEMNSSYNLYSIRFVTNWGVISLSIVSHPSSVVFLSTVSRSFSQPGFDKIGDIRLRWWAASLSKNCQL